MHHAVILARMGAKIAPRAGMTVQNRAKNDVATAVRAIAKKDVKNRTKAHISYIYVC